MEIPEYYCQYARLRPQLLKIAKRYLKDAFFAEDLVEDTLMAGIKSLPGFNNGCLLMWLSTIMHRLYLKEYRLQKKRGELLKLAAINTVDYCCPPGIFDMVEKLSEELPAKLRIVFKLIRLEGCTNEETPEKLYIPLGTVKSRLARADNHIRKCLRYQVLV